MAANPLPDIEYLRECLDYDPCTGILRWRTRPPSHFTAPYINRWNSKFAGTVAGREHQRHIQILGRDYQKSRIIWKLVYGSDPEFEIDHIDCNKFNNKLENLRVATHSQNGCNRRRPLANRSGLKGASWSPEKQKWEGQIKIGGKRRFLGYFATPEAAHAAYCKASARLHGEFGRTS